MHLMIRHSNQRPDCLLSVDQIFTTLHYYVTITAQPSLKQSGLGFYMIIDQAKTFSNVFKVLNVNYLYLIPAVSKLNTGKRPKRPMSFLLSTCCLRFASSSSRLFMCDCGLRLVEFAIIIFLNSNI